MSIVTIFGEASWSPRTLAAAWAAFCDRDGAAILRAGPHGFRCAHSQEAEFAALAHGLMAAAEQGMIAGADAVILESDCMEALSTLRWSLGVDSLGPRVVPAARRPGVSMRDNDAVLNIQALVRPLSCKVVVRHAKDLLGREEVRRECRAMARAERIMLEAADTNCRGRRCS